MRLGCPICKAEYNIDERRLPRGGANVRCPKCKGVFPVLPPGIPAVVPAPPAGETPLERVPLPAPTSTATEPPNDPGPGPGLEEPWERAVEQAVTPPPAALVSPPVMSPPARAAGTNVVAPPDDEALRAAARPPPSLDFGEIDFGDDSPFSAEPESRGNGAPAAARAPQAASEAPVAGVGRPSSAPGVLGNEEPFPFDTNEPPLQGSSDGSLTVPDDPFAAAPPAVVASGAGGRGAPVIDHAGPVAEHTRDAVGDRDPAHTDLAAMLPEPAPADASASTQEVAADEELEALFDSATRRAPESTAAAAPPPLPAAERDVGRTVTATVPRAPPRVAARDARGGGVRRWGWIAAAGAVVVIVGAGIAAGFVTPYGFFLHRLVRGQTGAQRPAAKILAEARTRLAEDRFTSTKAAVELCDRALRVDPGDLEAKASYTYAVSLLARRHGGAAAAWTRARGYLQDVTKRAGSDAQAARAVVAAALVTADRPVEAAIATLEREVAKAGVRDGDALLALGDAALARGNATQASAYYARLDALQPGTARASHVLGVAAARRGDRATAERLLKAALAADPQHLESVVELGTLALAAGNRGGAEAAARALLAPEAQAETGPRERARAHALLGLIAARSVGDHVESALAAAEHELETAVREDADDLDVRLALASFLLDRGTPDKAAAALAPAVAASPREPRVASVNALVLAAQGRAAEATTALDAALERNPGDARLLHTKGLLAAGAGKQGDADRFWSEAAARDPAAFEPHLSIAQARFLRGDLEGADKELKLAAERAPASPGVVSLGGDLLLARRDLEGAEEAYRRALTIDGACGAAYLGLARVALERGEVAQARGELQRAVNVSPRLAAAQALQGEVLWKARELPAARKALEAAVALDPQDAMSMARLGAVELQQGDGEAAVAHLKTASAAVVGSAEVRAWYGRALLARGELQPGIEQLRKSIELDPRDALVHLQLGQALERVASIAEAAEAYRAAQARAPRMMEPYEALGVLYSAQNRCGDALPQLEKAAALAPREQRVRVEVADCKARLGHHAEAAAIYRRVLEADPKQVGLYYKIARAQHEASGVREAMPWYERAAREEPGNPMPHYYLAFAYKERGQGAKAIAEFRSYLRVNPNAEDRKDIEREIEYLGGTPDPAPRR